MRTNSKCRQSYTPEEIAGWISRYRVSGLGLQQFAKEHGIASTRLHYWVYRSGGRKLARPETVSPVFQELKLANSLPGIPSWGAEMSLPGGMVVRFSGAVSPVWIGSVVQALHRPC